MDTGETDENKNSLQFVEYLVLGDGSSSRSIKCVIVGDGFVGKTALLINYQSNKFNDSTMPFMCESFTVNVLMDCVVKVKFQDSMGIDDYERLQIESYPGTDVLLLCFSVISPSSYESIRNKWYPEIKRYCNETPFVLIGTKTDLRTDTGVITELNKKDLLPVSTSQGQALAGAAAYCECSSKTQDGLSRVLQEAVKAALKPTEIQKKLKKCIIS